MICGKVCCLLCRVLRRRLLGQRGQILCTCIRLARAPTVTMVRASVMPATAVMMAAATIMCTTAAFSFLIRT